MIKLKVFTPCVRNLLLVPLYVLCLKQGWFEVDREHNHNVYVSGLPLDTTKEEFVELMSKCGIITENDEGTLMVQ